jgi:LPS sulfotransferase NodH
MDIRFPLKRKHPLVKMTPDLAPNPYLKHQVGTKIDHDLSFVPFTLIEDVFGQKRTLTTWTLGPQLDCPCAIKNETAKEFTVDSVKSKPLIWRSGDMTLHPGQHREIAILRQTVLRASLLRIMVSFKSHNVCGKSTDVTVAINGSLIWRSASSDCFDGEIKLEKGDQIDIGVGVLPGCDYTYCTTLVEFSAFARNSVTGEWFKVDDGFCSHQSIDVAGHPIAHLKGQGAIVSTDHWRRKSQEFFASFWADAAHAKACFDGGKVELYDRLTKKSLQGPALKRYVIFFTPRSGSTLLTERISTTGVLGYPLEYFVENFFLSAMSQAENNYETPLDFMESRLATDNGVFGFQIDGERFFRSSDYFRDKLRSFEVVYLTRDDLLLQAISCYRATQFGIWRANSPGAVTQYSRDPIIAHLRDLLQKADAFEEYFERESVTPLRIRYEDIVSDAEGVLLRIANHVGIEPDTINFETRNLSERIVRGTESTDWKMRLMASGGEYAGYNIYSDGGERVALLAGLDFSTTKISRLDEPLIFRGKLLADVYHAIDEYQAEFLGVSTC